MAELRPGVPLSMRQVEEFERESDGPAGKQRIETRVSRDSRGRIRIEPTSDSLPTLLFDPVAGSMSEIDLRKKLVRQWKVPGIVPSPGVMPSVPGAETELTTLGSRVIAEVTFIGVRLTERSERGGAPHTTERWFSLELGLHASVETLTGEYRYSAHIEDLKREEPDPGLFMVPPGFRIELLQPERIGK